MSDVQMFWSLCAECIEFLNQRRNRAVLMESRHEKGQTDKQGLHQRKRSDSVGYLYLIHAWMGRVVSFEDESCRRVLYLFICRF